MSERLQTLNDVLSETFGNSWRAVLLSYMVLLIIIAVLLYLLTRGKITLSCGISRAASLSLVAVAAVVLMLSISGAYLSYQKDKIDLNTLYGQQIYMQKVSVMKLINFLILAVLGAGYFAGILILGLKKDK